MLVELNSNILGPVAASFPLAVAVAVVPALGLTGAVPGLIVQPRSDLQSRMAASCTLHERIGDTRAGAESAAGGDRKASLTGTRDARPCLRRGYADARKRWGTGVENAGKCRANVDLRVTVDDDRRSTNTYDCFPVRFEADHVSGWRSQTPEDAQH